MNSDASVRTSDVRVRPLTAAVVAALGAVCSAASADAQVTEPLEEVIVTASRRATTVEDLPVNLTALSGEALEQQRNGDLAELGRWVPGLSVLRHGLRASNRMRLR